MVNFMMYLMCFVLLVAVAGHKHHPKFPKNSEDYITQATPRKVACSREDSGERDRIIDQSKCGEPKEVFEYLKINAAHEQVSPRAIWVKRCVGLCEYDNEGTCVPTETVTRHIPIRIYNVKTNKESCATYPIVEHVSCGCCALAPEDCAAPRVFNPRKCACQCPNLEERRSCHKKRNQNMKWIRSKCTCEMKIRT